jgi:hypothetical protein
MIYVVETFQLSDDGRADGPFGEWLHEFNSLVLDGELCRPSDETAAMKTP